MKNPLVLILYSILLFSMQSAYSADETSTQGTSDQDTYKQETILKEAEDFFGKGAKGLADVIAKVFKDQGRPNGYIKGEEISGAIGVGVRYGNGTLVLKNGPTRKVYWQSPSIGFDIGANAVKVFTLVYNLHNVDNIFQRFPGVTGSLYFVAGVGVTYQRSDNIVLAPIRFGVGWRQGISIGYMDFTREKSWNPF
jgi:hypothetical protein